MYWKITKIFIIAAALLGNVFILAFAASSMDTTPGKTWAGTVLFVDADTGLLWLQSSDGDIVKMIAPTTLIKGLSKGEAISLSITEPFDNRRNKAPFDQMVSASVQNIDAAKELLRLKTENGEIIDVQAADKLRSGLQEGESVVVGIRMKKLS